MKHFLILLILFIFIKSSSIGLLQPFNLTDTNSHKISGRFCTAPLFPGSPNNCGTSTFIIDPINQRFKQVFSLVLNFTGIPTLYNTTYLYLNNATYIWDRPLSLGCNIVGNNYNFSTLAFDYQQIVSQPDSSKRGYSAYTGLTKSGSTCGFFSSIWILFQNGLFNQFQGSVNTNVSIPGESFCYNSKDVVIFDRRTIKRPPFKLKEFALRSDCYTATDYCSTNPGC